MRVVVTIRAERDGHPLPDMVTGEGDSYTEALCEATLALLDTLSVDVYVDSIFSESEED